jgi:hypothetical protein
MGFGAIIFLITQSNIATGPRRLNFSTVITYSILLELLVQVFFENQFRRLMVQNLSVELLVTGECMIFVRLFFHILMKQNEVHSILMDR